MFDENEIQSLCMRELTYLKGQQLRVTGAVKEIQEEEAEEPEAFYISALVEDRKIKSPGRNFRDALSWEKGEEEECPPTSCAVWLRCARADSEIEDYGCECPGFSENPGMCEHCAATALAYLERRRSTERMNSYRSLLADAQKERSDKEIVSMIQDYAMRQRMREQEAQGTIELIPRLHEKGWNYYFGRRSYALTFHIGPESGRKYVLKNLSEFVRAVEREEKYTYGKQLSFVHSKSMFTERGWQYVQLILTAMEMRSTKSDAADKELQLNLATLEDFFSLNIGKEVPYDCLGYPYDTLRIFDGNPPVKLRLRKEREQFRISIPPLSIWKGNEYLFVRMDHTVYRCSQEYREAMERFLESASAEKAVSYKIAREDMMSFCAAVLPELEREETVDTDGLDLGQYRPRKAAIAYYLDEEDGRVTLRTECSYGAQSFLLPQEGAGAAELEEYRDRVKERRALETARAYFPYEDAERGLLCFSSSENDRMFQLLDTGIRQLEEVLESYRRRKKYHRLRSGDFLEMGQNAATTVAELLDGLGLSEQELSEETLRLPKFRACYIDQVLKGGAGQVRVSRDTYYRAVLREMKNVEDSEYRVPEQFPGILREYQKTGYRWLRTLAQLGFGGILADEMGLGKTVQTIAYLWARKDEGCSRHPSLIVCPASLVYNWKRELERFAPGLKVRLLVGSAAEREAQICSGAKPADRIEEQSGGEERCEQGSERSDGEERYVQGSEQSDGVARYVPASKKSGREAKCVYMEETPDGAAESTDRAEEQEQLLAEDVWITSYDLLKRDIEWYQGVSFDTEIIDEAQNIKNQGTQAARSVKRIQARVRFALTGTPIENRLSELWSIFDYLMPGLLGTYEQFRRGYELPIVQEDTSASERLRRMVSPFILRRLKQEVLKELPDKLEQIVYAQMGEEQRAVYAGHVRRLQEQVAQKSQEELQRERLQILAELTRLRQICCDPALLYEDYTAGACKVDTCMELVKEAVEGKHKVLIFSQFTSIFPVLKKRLEAEGIACHELTGRTSKEERQQMTEAFQTDEVPVFLISLKAGGTGLNLTAASIVIHFDPWWNLAAQNQATDRAHRIGQRNEVVVFRLIAQDTIEEKIVELQEKKQELAGRILAGESLSAAMLTREELLEILR